MASHFTLVSMPGELDCLSIPGLDGWISSNRHPVLSLVRWTTQDRARAEDALDQVLDMCRSRGQGFDMMTGPRCEAAGLLSLLRERGFLEPPVRVAAMLRQISADTLPNAAPEHRVWNATAEEDDRLWKLMAEGFDVPHEVGRIFHRAYMTSSDKQRTDIYGGALENSDHLAGVGYLSYIGDGPVVLLRVSVTDASCRGQGLYHAMVYERLRDAAAAGRSWAVVHAYSDSSEQVLGHMGFSRQGTFLLHRWRP
ncbi:MAG: hypothetical protein AAF484_09435 [Pseudomonadota bacterium]